MNQQQKTLLNIVLLIITIGAGATYYNRESNEIVPTSLAVTFNDVASSTPNIIVVTASNTKSINNGAKPTTTKTVSISTAYDVPDHNKNTITVNLTLENGTIKYISHTEKAADNTSKMIYDNFSKNLNKANIIGKKIGDVSLSKVGGASLTTKAFMLSLNKLAQMQ